MSTARIKVAIMSRVLYHGTSQYRADKIRIQGMKSRMPRGLISDKIPNEEGYCYFTDSFQEACDYAVRQVFIDEKTPKAHELMKLKSWHSVGIVISLFTNGLPNAIEIDSRGLDLKELIEKKQEKDIYAVTSHGIPWRVKGWIPTRYLGINHFVDLARNSTKVIAIHTFLELLIKSGNLKLVEGYDLP